ncbi:hypothetical protein SS50377_23720 [Spironucleus salmonicida]|uniref:Uncharacterized protein n=1 Tax=Spironucleus salmonicida TaxID=348837 RepID=V6LZW6_9EUKA|nr:hypothetical protein SS50377_23720 [Spironucleus salmonicida]|eukprot:EST46399.1 Hypothetical protein SS50377_13483 [Spironucleus salmonicida]
MKLTVSILPQNQKFAIYDFIDIFNDNKQKYIEALQNKITKKVVDAFIFQSAYGYNINVQIKTTTRKKIISLVDPILTLTKELFEQIFSEEQFVVVLKKLVNNMCTSVAMGPTTIGWSTLVSTDNSYSQAVEVSQ